MESWALWSIVCVLFGMAGFWGGVLQHAHNNAGEGGTLGSYTRLIAKDNTLNTVQGTVAPTDVNAIVLPANTSSASSRIKITACGWFDNTTGLAQTSPTISVRIGGITIMTLPGVAAIPSGGNSNGWYFEINGTRRLGGNVMFFEGRVVFDDPLSATLVPRIDGIRLTAFTVDPTIDRTIDVRITNAVVTVGYATSCQGTALELN